MHFFRNSLLIIVVFLFVFLTKANSSVYVVDNYSYVTNLKTVKKNRNRVLEKIKIQALNDFILKVTLAEDGSKVKIKKDYQKLIRSFVIKNELKLKNNKYEIIAKIEIDPSKIKKLLDSNKIKFVSFKSSPILTIVVKKEKNQFSLLIDQQTKEDWLDNSDNELLDFFFLNGDLKDIQLISALDKNFYQITKLDEIISNYGVRDFVFLVFDYDVTNKENIFLKYQFNELKFTKKKRVENLRNLNLKNEFSDLRRVLNYSWKEIQILSPKKRNQIIFKYNYDDLAGYVSLKRKITNNKNINLLEDTQVTSRQYIGKMTFSGSIEQIVDSFQKEQLFLEKINGEWFFK